VAGTTEWKGGDTASESLYREGDVDRLGPGPSGLAGQTWRRANICKGEWLEFREAATGRCPGAELRIALIEMLEVRWDGGISPNGGPGVFSCRPR